MKKIFFLLSLFFIVQSINAQIEKKTTLPVPIPTLKIVQYPKSTRKFEKYEIDLFLKEFTGNPYNPEEIDIYAVFRNENTNEIYKVNAFYFKDYQFTCNNLPDGNHEYGSSQYEETFYESNNQNINWKIRFSPPSVGEWNFTIFYSLNQISYHTINNNNFTCFNSSYHGIIKKSNSKKNLIRDNQLFFPIGENIERSPYSSYTLNCIDTHNKIGGICMFNKWLEELKSNNGNYIRFQTNAGFNSPSSLIYYNNNKPQQNFDIYLDNAFRIDKYFEKAENLDIAIKFSIIKSDLLNETISSLWNNKNPWKILLDKEGCSACSFFFNENAKKEFKNLLRYIIARWGYSTQILAWELFDEVDLAKDETGSCINHANIDMWFDEMKSEIKNLDPLNHLVSSGGFTSGGISWTEGICPKFKIVDNMMGDDHSNNKVMLCQNHLKKEITINHYG